MLAKVTKSPNQHMNTLVSQPCDHCEQLVPT